VTREKTTAAGFDVGVVGALHVRAPGVRVTHGTLRSLRGQPLVVVSAAAVDPRAASAAAAANPTTQFALVGASTKGIKQPNLVGLVFRDDEAAHLGGILAGLVAGDEGGTGSRVAWVGPGAARVLESFRTGVHLASPGTSVLDVVSPPTPARCKEAALGVFLRGAVAVMSGEGLCADAVADAAAEQNRVAASLGDFEFSDVAVAAVVRSALAGAYPGGEDLVFGWSSGAIGVRHLDPRVPADAAVQVRRAAQQLASGSPATVG
jgi:basic membrane lipoprotein Med (substrate-binding protein (PBP1-ABC) superfamily)